MCAFAAMRSTVTSREERARGRTALCAQRATARDRNATIHSNQKPGPRHTHHSRVKFRQRSVSSGGRGQDMRQALLLNPFNSNPEPAQIVSRRPTRSTHVCSNCQPHHIISHAVAQWSNESQEWQLASTFDQPAHCNGCNGPCAIVCLPFNSTPRVVIHP